MKSNVRKASGLTTHEGAPSPHVSAAKQLRRAVMSNMLFENQFYEDGVSIADRIVELSAKVSFDELATCAIDARERFKLRHVPLLLLCSAIKQGGGRRVGDLIARVIQRPDEIGELLALYWKDGKRPIAYQLKRGLQRAIKKFNEYSLAKNDSGAIKLRDALFMIHAKPKRADMEAEGIDGLVGIVPAIDKPNYKRGRVLRNESHVFTRITNRTMATPDTWEVQLSSGADKKETFTRLLRGKKIGALALLRNLRNMIAAGVSSDDIWLAISTMKTDRILPFRFLSAAKYAPQFEPVLETAMFRCIEEMPKLDGPTAVLIDHSHSMNNRVSKKSEISSYDAAAAVAMLARELCERCRVFTFSTDCIEIPPRRGFAMRAAIDAVRRPASTLLGKAVKHIYSEFEECRRIIVITDEQSADRPPHPQGHGYIVNVAGYQNGIAYGPWVSIDGWSEAVLDYIREYEHETN